MTEIKTSVAKVVIMGVDDEGNYISLLVDEKGQLKLAADVDLEWPSGNDALLKNKTITDIISGGKLKILNDLSGYATESTLADVLETLATPGSIGHGRKTVTTAGTAEAIGEAACRRVIITALRSNTGYIAVGGSGVVATAGNETGEILARLDTTVVEVDNLADVYIDATVDGEGVSFRYEV